MFHLLKRIPPDFVKCIQKDMTNAVLECPNGRIWNVRLQKSSRGTFLQEGWREFVNHHSLEEYDLLVFGYDGNVKFSVRIYDRTACERDEVCDQEKATKTFNQVGGEDEFIGGQSTPSKHSRPVKIESEDVEFKTSNNDSGLGIRTRASENANAFTSKFPFFTKEMTKSDMVDGKLAIPIFFVREHLGEERRIMLLRGPDGRPWETCYFTDRRKRGCVARGWMRFLKGYNIAQGEICVFELVGETQMQVHIFRSIQ